MKLWNKIKKILRPLLEEEAQREVDDFVCEAGYFGVRSRHKQRLTATYACQEGDDLLAKKQDFIDQYTINEQKLRLYFTSGCLKTPTEVRCKAWRDHEQIERREAQKAWRQVAKRNYHAHMRQKFMNQKTR